MCETSIYFSEPSLSAGAPHFRLLWRQHCAEDGPLQMQTRYTFRRNSASTMKKFDLI